MGCFSFPKLVDFAGGALPAPERQGLLDHIASGCRRCREQTDLLKEMLSWLAAHKERAAPADTLKAAFDLFDQVRKPTLVDTIRKKVTAILAFDSFRQPAPAGIRNPKGLRKQLLFKAEGYDIDLRFSPAPGSPLRGLTGQVLQKARAAGAPHAVVCLAEEGQQILLTATDAFGMFGFRALHPERRYDLDIALPDVEVRITGVSPA